ncbi:transposase [Flintibacter sp. NSJ-23]|uniref:Transposase n=1 Tax=Flintibacter hominis TaxID=2763048 RepID=A0A8J6J8G0_9FIRM|nr:transposase [Flintibacter hominis]
MAEEELLALMERYPMIRLDKYVIMPNHIHVLLRITQETAEASPRPTLMQAMAAWKSLSTRRWNRMTGNAGEKLWQQGYYEHIIRDDNDFMAHWTYIDQNPARWSEDEYFGGTP